ncbi:ABC transporter substrate-binding protein [uncultured Campylobacter sp.]|uniref:Tgt2/MlaC family protein n=1 Tax=uncultured Campylobacter sp. TaxID=218934 RepID=UPI0015B972A2|nr:ABC transporter substrate-binding protein [uncultured Campylobacter sp.]
MKILKILTMILLFTTSLFAISKEQIKPEVEMKTTKVIEILKDTNLDNNAKTKEIFALLDQFFDYKQMAKISLGKRYNSLSSDEQAKFDAAFEQKLKSSYIDKLLGYKDQEIHITGESEPQKNRYWLTSELTNDSKSYEFVYKFYDAKERGWLIYDLDIVGVSIIQTYRSQFGDVLNNADFNTLLQKLNEAVLPDQNKTNP